MTDFQPLYIGGKRDSRRRYISPTGEIISRRQYIKITEGVTPEQKAIRRYQEGKSKAGVTVRRHQRKEKLRKADIKKPRKVWGDEYHQIPQKLMPTEGDRGYYQLQGTYLFYNVKYRYYAESIGYSIADDTKQIYGSPNYLFLRREAIKNAVAKLDGYDWKYIGVIEEYWLVW
jgi:hypothetical protein